MASLTLDRLSLLNFKGIRWFTLDLNGANACVYGANEAGKTTLADALRWLLTGKNSDDKKEFSLKTLDTHGDALHHLNHEVEGIFVFDGRRLTLKKVYSEKWTKKRGSAAQEYAGHTTDHFVDGVPVTEREYTERVAQIASEDALRLLTSPTYFHEILTWQKRREILLQVCGDLTDAEVIGSDEKLSTLPEILGGRKLEDHRKVIAARKAEINRDLQAIPVRIDEAERAMADLGYPPVTADADIAVLKGRIEEKQQIRFTLDSGGAVAECRVKLRECEAEISRLQNEQRDRETVKSFVAKQALAEVNGRIADLETQIGAAKRRYTQITEEAEEIARRIEAKREQWHTVDAQVCKFLPDSICPSCGQDLPEDRIAEARENALANFNATKAGALELIQTEGKRMAAQGESLIRDGANISSQLAELEEMLATERANAARIQADIDLIGSRPIAPNPALATKLKEKEVYEAQVQRLQGNSAEAVAVADAELGALKDALRAMEAAKLRDEQRKAGQMRIADLKAREKTLAKEFERLEAELYLTEEFTRAKVALLETSVNSRFRLARFKLFEPQVNGGISDTCVVTYQGVPYPDLNGAAKIQIGLDVIRTLSEHYGLAAPIIIDNRESVTRLPEMDAQVISLVVSDEDKTLRVEREENGNV